MKRQRQQGVAVVTALLLTTLAVTIVTSLFWLQQVQVRSMENQRLQLQTRWILRGALDLSRLVLNQDLMDSPNYTQLNGVWATPLEETRLDDYVERERLQGESFDATLSGRMVDAQGRYNLANLADSTKQLNLDELAVFKRLLENLKLDSSLAQGVADLVLNATPAPNTQTTGGQTTGAQTAAAVTTTGSQPMGLVRVEDLLAVSGFTPQAIEQLRDYVIILPVSGTTVNVNTAPAELLSALVPGLSLSDAAAMVSARKTSYYRDTATFLALSQMVGKQIKAKWNVKSDYFLAYSRVRLDRAALDTQSLLKRPGSIPNTTVEWIREY
ncbi:type II secretion system minor pseudopilin GspK [Duganella radicis]|uniref:Type II secretion system protein K n=1 Tax=Duganella radicis TaxID=551988 RepID=A0A6L6PN85_9BURK|nr:type II secretion system minor pseudopilin GspK [Duganella radicis]MTV40372.1 general secretion pathway protein GspK [Duganella radicis]